MKRRGIFEVQFNWIFILIAGAVILAFFFSIVQKQKDFSEQKLSISLLNEFDALTTGASVTKGAAQSIPLPRAGMDFKCEACDCKFSIGNFGQDYDDKIIFAPKRIEGKNVVFWTLDWQIPYRGANFLYATSDRMKYFIVSDNSPGSLQLRQKVESDLPTQVNAEFIEVAKICDTGPDCIENANYIQAKFIFLDIQFQGSFDSQGLSLHRSFKDAEVSAVYVTGNDLHFFECPRWRTTTCDVLPTSYFAGDASLYGAIFAQDIDMYECNMQFAARRLEYVTGILGDRIDAFNQDSGIQGRGCAYDPVPLEALSQTASSQSLVINQRLPDLESQANAIDAQNRRLIRLSCPTIY